jgi:hypothetical protein
MVGLEVGPRGGVSVAASEQQKFSNVSNENFLAKHQIYGTGTLPLKFSSILVTSRK